MPSPSASQHLDRDASNARSVAARYRRAERAASWTLALLVAAAFLAAVVALSFWPGVAVGTALVVALRVPVFRRRGSTRLRTDAPPAAVVDQFASAKPPNLAFQWGVADEVRNPTAATARQTQPPPGAARRRPRPTSSPPSSDSNRSNSTSPPTCARGSRRRTVEPASAIPTARRSRRS
ncbi:hypothetical protein C464_04743 [Halorubrum coriense DSM 10284]|uniref:Uncharacterized protein n=1 Tax=Halorubrum coriense DSM 10284 TaxID=1227466 RepID=M0EQK6_9EURY|nr:hypothetical protein [Halorubrum coriense]ELZ49373.1 hypothetical protein C464_04743 [Halorubrum coriense DSM 10284]